MIFLGGRSGYFVLLKTLTAYCWPELSEFVIKPNFLVYAYLKKMV